jgi:2-isopropylmalate synthase
MSTGGMPYVSRTAFAHKAGTHIDAVMKDTSSFEHVDPSMVGNKRNLLVSGLSGRSAILPLLQAFAPNTDRQSPEADRLLEVIKEHETLGYQYESAHASLELLVRKTLGIHRSHFRVDRFTLFNEQTELSESNASWIETTDSKIRLPKGLSSAFIKVSVDGQSEVGAAESDGPVNALNMAIRKALHVFYPQLNDVQMIDYKVRVIDGSLTQGTVVRVMIDTTNGSDTFTTIGVSADIIEASKQAVIDSLEYVLYKTDKEI